ncbi:MAG: type IX secretion system membrane protein PorP/SprF [Flavobacteriales bacterium]|nr:type IX secretion system membrane protein PorP/SprF [Flavobacteriales bacterium]
MATTTIKRLTLLFSICWIAIQGNGQQDPQFSQYFFNTLAVNSGYAGSRDMLNVTLLAREQWLGMEGRPRTQTLAIHSPLTNDAIGLGLSVINDQLGPVRNTSIMGDVAYRIRVTHRSRLAFGVKAGLNLFKAGLADLEGTDADDIAFSQNITTRPLPNFGFSLYWWSDRHFLGFSTPKLIENDLSRTDEVVSIGKEKRHFFVIGGMVFNVHPVIKFKPTFQLKYVAGSPVSADFTGNILFDDVLWIGGFYRIGDAAGALLSYQITDQLRLGYSYDYTLSKLSNFTSGSHEIMVSYDFRFRKDGIISPRFF